MAIGICCKNCYKDYAFKKYMRSKKQPEIFVCKCCSDSHNGSSSNASSKVH